MCVRVSVLDGYECMYMEERNRRGEKGDLLAWEGKNRLFCAKLELKFVYLILVSMQNYSETGVIEHLKKDINFST